MKGLASLLLMAFLITLSATDASGTPEQKCQADKNRAAGKHAACRQNAEAKLATNGDMTKYAGSRGKCDAKFTNAWQKAIDKAAAAGATCLDAPLTVEDFQAAMDAHSANIATALRCGAFPTHTCTIQTGQVTSYGPGSDGDLLQGTARSYTDHGDGTITDNLTGLMWEKKSDDGSVHDKDNRYTWGDNLFMPSAMNGTIVTTFLATLNAGEGFAGYTDWRIPNANELHSLVNYENVSPAVSAVFNAGCAPTCSVTTCSCTDEFSYWSSTTYHGWPSGDPSWVWVVHFNDGEVGAGYKGFDSGSGFSAPARAVRGGS